MTTQESPALPLLATKGGKEFYLQRDGTWYTQPANPQSAQGFVLIGSIDPAQNPKCVAPQIQERLDAVETQLKVGEVPGLNPCLKEGYTPLGLFGISPTQFLVQEEGFGCLSRPSGFGLGNQIGSYLSGYAPFKEFLGREPSVHDFSDLELLANFWDSMEGKDIGWIMMGSKDKTPL